MMNDRYHLLKKLCSQSWVSSQEESTRSSTTTATSPCCQTTLCMDGRWVSCPEATTVLDAKPVL